MRYYLGVLLAVVLLAVPWLAFNYPDQIAYFGQALERVGVQLAAVITHNPRSVSYLQAKYQVAGQANPQKRVRILIVPGHEPFYGGAEFRDIKERDLTVDLANNLADFLRQNTKYEAMVSRTGEDWSPTFVAYFKDHWNDIIDWEKSYKQEMSRIISIGLLEEPQAKVEHNTAPQDVAVRLYGVTKWANENDVDVVIHIHLNDNPGHGVQTEGKYSGFAIYVPAGQYLNSGTTHAIADKVFDRLKKYNPVSDFPGESGGIVDEPELIAIGANNTSDAASMLIEYGYLYEPQFANADVRSIALKDLAYQTYLGLQDFFDPSNATNLARSYDTLILPYTWNQPIKETTLASRDVFALQTALLVDGLYPPSGKGKNDCPRTGKIGGCTKAAVASFQKKYGIVGGEGGVGPRTIEELNRLYGLKAI